MTPAPQAPAPLPEFVSMRDLRRILGGAASATINEMVAAGTLPEPVRPRRNMVLFERGALHKALSRLSATA
jgi:hypothetical protein